MKALVVDDSQAIRMLVGKMLEPMQMEIFEAENGRIALELLDGGLDPELVVVDWNMPEVTGIEFIQAARRAPYNLEARIVMATTENEHPRIVEALNAGADEYVMKPFTEEAFHAKLKLVGIEPR
jgi:two-component system chemotaxis response regulator CheY